MNTLRAYISSVRNTFYLVFYEADTTTIRLILAWGSFVSALSLLIDNDKFLDPVYRVIAIFGDEKAWAAYFLLHWAGVHWRILERSRQRPGWALAINAFGFTIWFVSTCAFSWATGAVGIFTSLGFVMCAASAWALFRTGFRPEVVT